VSRLEADIGLRFAPITQRVDFAPDALVCEIGSGIMN
jgi:hypothetical protein